MTIEQIIVGYLSSSLSVPVSGDVPINKPDEFVTVEKIGSGEKDHIRSATLAIQSWSMSQDSASTLNEAVKAAMDGAVVLDAISRSHCETDYNFTDTSTKRHRYQAVYTVVYH